MADKTRPAGAVLPRAGKSTEYAGYDRAACGLREQAHFSRGFTPAMFAAICRQSADEAGTSPRH